MISTVIRGRAREGVWVKWTQVKSGWIPGVIKVYAVVHGCIMSTRNTIDPCICCRNIQGTEDFQTQIYYAPTPVLCKSLFPAALTLI